MKYVISNFDEPHNAIDDSLSMMKDIPPHFWAGSKYTTFDGKWGPMGRHRGFQEDIGGGKVFAHPTFLAKECITGSHEFMRCLIAELHGVCPWELQRKDTGATLKYPGAKALAPHRDNSRIESYQNVLSTSQSEFSVWPGTHKYFGEMKLWDKGYLSDDGIGVLRKAGFQELLIPASAGDVLIFVGGKLIHGSPKIPSESTSPRICTYPEFWKIGSVRKQHVSNKRKIYHGSHTADERQQ
jgi:hypothetical protein